MLSKKAELIRHLVVSGNASDVLALMEGESPYTTEASEGAPTDSVLGRIWVGALHHLRFVSEFGPDAEPQMKDGKAESPFPDVFAQWLEADAPGIGASDLDDYMNQREH